jgi:hypothetical protein
MARILRGFVAPTPATGSQEGVQALQTEINDNVNKMQMQMEQLVNTEMAKVQAKADRRADAMAKAQAEADWRADAMFQKLAQMLETVLSNENNRVLPYLGADATPGSARQGHDGQGGQQPVRVGQPSWSTKLLCTRGPT